jgi:hypothetical protein
MKIYFNRRPVLGPWGGGTKVLSAIVEECKLRGHEVLFEEQIHFEQNIDALFCVDPRPTQTIDFHQLLSYKKNHPKTKLLQRVGDLGTHGKPELLELVKASSQFADALIFPSKWARDYLSSSKDYYVILNAPLSKFLVKKTNKTFSEKLKIVSHHWSNNSLKGFEIYKQLDDYCSTSNADFCFIGRKPEDLILSNYIPPQDVEGLINLLPSHDVYVTASKQEAGANHVLEAMALGLPVLYHKDGGSINEYCENFGLQYENFEDLIYILENKKDFLQSLAHEMSYSRSSTDMAKEYVNLFESL